tara:strand:+ start:2087 stop:2470 length:384 start_codon:yes stop_codon:yes gene_type:complete
MEKKEEQPKQTWEELESCGHSPRMIEAILNEQEEKLKMTTEKYDENLINAEIKFLRKALRMLEEKMDADIDKAIDILNQVIGDDDDKTLKYFKIYQKQLNRDLIIVRTLGRNLNTKGVGVMLRGLRD